MSLVSQWLAATELGVKEAIADGQVDVNELSEQ
jgi:hypothetical protein